jgi:hypothetical protein
MPGPCFTHSPRRYGTLRILRTSPRLSFWKRAIFVPVLLGMPLLPSQSHARRLPAHRCGGQPPAHCPPLLDNACKDTVGARGDIGQAQCDVTAASGFLHQADALPQSLCPSWLRRGALPSAAPGT